MEKGVTEHVPQPLPPLLLHWGREGVGNCQAQGAKRAGWVSEGPECGSRLPLRVLARPPHPHRETEALRGLGLPSRVGLWVRDSETVWPGIGLDVELIRHIPYRKR